MDFVEKKIPDLMEHTHIDMHKVFNIIILIPVINVLVFLNFLSMAAYVVYIDIDMYFRIRSTLRQQKRIRQQETNQLRRFIKAKEEMKRIEAEQASNQ
jgi:hypothetical protein